MYGYQLAQAYQDHMGRVDQLLVDVDGSVAAIQEQIGQLKAERQEALTALGQAYLPELSPEALLLAEKLSGFRGFSRRDPLKAMAQEAKVLAHTAARIKEDPNYQRREYLVGPVGEYTRELAERRSMLEEWERECARFEELDGFMSLIEHKYDTPDFDLSWWQTTYWSLWAKGDAICVALGLDDFGDDVLPAYEKVRVPRDGWRNQVLQSRAKVHAIHELVRTHDQSLARIEQLPEIYLEQCQKILGEFLDPADPGLLNDWCVEAGSDRAILLALRRVAGLAAKIDAMGDALTGLGLARADLQQRRRKYGSKAAKYRRSKNSNRLIGEEADPKFSAKATKLEAELHKLRQQMAQLNDFDDYDRLDLDLDPQRHWMSMTRKRPTRFSPTLRNWYARNPDAAPALLDDDDDDLGTAVAVGAAVAAMDRHDGGYLS